MKKLFIMLILIVALVGCGNTAQEVSKETINTTEKNIKEIKTVTFLPTNSYEIKTSSGGTIGHIRFNGFVNKLQYSDWIVSFSQTSNFEVNNFFIVKEGSKIKIYKSDIEIVKLEPENNQITVKIMTE